MSQTDLGNAVALTFQQIQKYERGSNRISSSRLYEFSKVLNVPIPYFFDEMPVAKSSSPKARKKSTKATNFEESHNTRAETLKLVRAYYTISSANIRSQIRHLLSELAV